MKPTRCVLCECPILADERAIEMPGENNWAHASCSSSWSAWIDARAPRSPAPLLDPTDDETIPFRRSA